MDTRILSSTVLASRASDGLADGVVEGVITGQNVAEWQADCYDTPTVSLPFEDPEASLKAIGESVLVDGDLHRAPPEALKDSDGPGNPQNDLNNLL